MIVFVTTARWFCATAASNVQMSHHLYSNIRKTNSQDCLQLPAAGANVSTDHSWSPWLYSYSYCAEQFLFGALLLLLVSLEINSFNISSCQIHYSNCYGNHSCITGIYLYYWLIRPYQWLVGLGCESILLPWYVIDWFCFVVVIAISSLVYHQCSFRLDQWLIESI